MAISPGKLVELFKNPILSIKDQDLVKKIEKAIDNDIIHDYGRRYNNNMEFIPDGFSCTIYTIRYTRDVTFESDELSKAHLLNSYKKQGWDIKLGSNWTWEMKFDMSELRNNTIDDILSDIENDIDDIDDIDDIYDEEGIENDN